MQYGVEVYLEMRCDMRLIDADALKKKLIYFEIEFDDGHHEIHYAYKEKDVDDAPTIDAVPVIRCKDCRYSRDEYGDGDCYCKRSGRELQWIGRRWDFFCAAGRKKGDGE